MPVMEQKAAANAIPMNRGKVVSNHDGTIKFETPEGSGQGVFIVEIDSGIPRKPPGEAFIRVSYILTSGAIYGQVFGQSFSGKLSAASIDEHGCGELWINIKEDLPAGSVLMIGSLQPDTKGTISGLRWITKTSLRARWRRWRKSLNVLVLRCYYCLNRSSLPPASYYLNFVRTTSPFGRPIYTAMPGPDAALKVLADGTRDFSDYNEHNFVTGEPRYENFDYFQGRVRKEDMGCAALYAFGVKSFAKAQRVFPETNFQDQVRAVMRSSRRSPRYIADVGCGLGSLSALLLACGVRVDAIDAGPMPQKTIRETIKNFTGQSVESFGQKFCFHGTTLARYMESLFLTTAFPDTFIFVESIEHIPKDEFLAAIKVMRDHRGCRLIVTSAVDFHPIYPDGTGWNHVTLVDDKYYDEIASQARRTVLRAGSHLVVEF
jgi:hypothetical protein